MGETSITFDVPVYGLEAVYKACYRFLDRLYIRLEGDPSGQVTVRLRPKADAKPQAEDTVRGEFENELLHQALRVKVAASNQKLREYIVSRALASAEGVPSSPARPSPASAPVAEVLDEDLEREIEKLLAEVEKEGGEDPLKIAVPWQEKEAKAKTPKKA